MIRLLLAAALYEAGAFAPPTLSQPARPLSALGAEVVVCGSTNNDLIVSGPRLPLAGETITHDSFATCFGGKGANQAVQAARMGADVSMVAKVGRDAFGEQMMANFADCGVAAEFVTEAAAGEPTGCAMITVGAAERTNTIVIVPGANAALTASDVRASESAFAGAKVLLTQLEVPEATTLAALELFAAASAAGGVSVLNTAPVPPGGVPDALLTACDVVCPNEVELALLVKRAAPIDTVVEAVGAARELLNRGSKRVLVTLGAKGALLVGTAGSVFVPALTGVDAIDTTGAGDSFLGAWAASVASGASPVAAMVAAGRVAAVTVSRAGTQPSFPEKAAVDLDGAPVLDLSDLVLDGADAPQNDWVLRDDGTLAPLAKFSHV